VAPVDHAADDDEGDDRSHDGQAGNGAVVAVPPFGRLVAAPVDWFGPWLFHRNIRPPVPAALRRAVRGPVGRAAEMLASVGRA
jgi:hypothetical protein